MVSIPAFFERSGIWGAADEAVFNYMQTNKIPAKMAVKNAGIVLTSENKEKRNRGGFSIFVQYSTVRQHGI